MMRLFSFRGRAPQDGHEILQLADAVGREKTRHEHVRVGPVDLLVPGILVRGTDGEVPTFLVVEDARKDAGRVEVRESRTNRSTPAC